MSTLDIRLLGRLAVVNGGEASASLLGLAHPQAGVEGKGLLVMVAGEVGVTEVAVGKAKAGVGAGVLVEDADDGGDVVRRGVVGERVRGIARFKGCFAETVEGPYLLLLVADLAGDPQGPLVKRGGSVGSAALEMQETEAVERARFVVVVAQLPAQTQRLVKVLGCGRMVPHAHLHVAQVNQRVGLAGLVADLVEQGQGSPVVICGRLQATQSFRYDTEVGQRMGLAHAITDPPEEGVNLSQVLGGWLVVALPFLNQAEIAEYAGLAMPVLVLPEQGQGLLQASGGLGVVTQLEMGGAEVGQGVGVSAGIR
jgi:hypothetical protein